MMTGPLTGGPTKSLLNGQVHVIRLSFQHSFTRESSVAKKMTGGPGLDEHVVLHLAAGHPGGGRLGRRRLGGYVYNIYIYTYIYIYREREKDIDRCVYIYI